MSRFYNYKNGRIHYSDRGRGKVIVLIHGYLETSDVWENFAIRLEKKFRVIAVDLPGHGRSDNFGDVCTMDLMAGIISDLLGSLEIKRSFLVGHSLGGYITLAFTDHFAEMLSGFCLFHSQPFTDTPETLEKRKKEIELVEAGKKDMFYPDNVTRMYALPNLRKFPEALLRSKEIASTIPGKAITGVLKGMMMRPSRLHVMESGSVPYLWILGAMDNHINCELMQSKVKLPEHSELVILRHSGHMGFVEEEVQAAKILTGFVNKLR